MKSFPERLEDFTEEVNGFIKQKTVNILTVKDKYIKFDEECDIAEGIVLGLSIDKDNEISVILNDEEIGEISFISLDFLSIDELAEMADIMQASRISLDSIDSI